MLLAGTRQDHLGYYIDQPRTKYLAMTSSYYVPKRPFNDGVYCPLTTAMTEDGQVNLEALNKQVVRLADAGMGIVLLGTNGEGERRDRSNCGLEPRPADYSIFMSLLS